MRNFGNLLSICFIILVAIGLPGCGNTAAPTVAPEYIQTEVAHALATIQASTPTAATPTASAAAARPSAAASCQGGELQPPPQQDQRDLLDVAITSVAEEDGGVRVLGTIHNQGLRLLPIPLSAFVFVDDAGQTYGVQSDAVACLAPDQTELFDLTIPAPHSQTLKLTIYLPEEQLHKEVLILVDKTAVMPPKR